MTKPLYNHHDVLVLGRCQHDYPLFNIEALRLRFRLFEGDWSPTVLRYCIQRRSAIGLLPFDPKTNSVVLVEQFRVGAMHDATTPWLFEIVAGVIDAEHHTPVATAKRETKEETGLSVHNITPMHDYWVSPGMTDERMYLFCGQVDSSKAGGIHGLVAEGENIRVHCMHVDQAWELVNQGRINNAPSIIALQWLKINHAELQATWS